MKKILLSFFAALCMCAVANAVPAYPRFINYTQPDGSVIKIRLHGDEFCHWVTDANGQVVEKDADGYYRPASEAQLSTRRAAAAMRRSQVNAARSRNLAKSGIANGQKHFLVILVQFKDVTFSNASTALQDFSDMLNQTGYSNNGGTGSARDFYYENSHGVFEPIFDVYGPVTLDNNRAYYGGNDSSGNDKKAEYAVKEGCQKVDSQFNVDFSQFDNDGDGAVDLVFMYYAGEGEADSDEEDAIWPHQWELSSAGISLTLDNKTIDKYACTNELIGPYSSMAGQMCGIGTACHEFGHAMGLPDFYDTDYDNYNGISAGMFYFSTMDSGSYNNEGRTPPFFTIEERIMLGWIDESCFQEFTHSGTYTIESVDNNVAYKTPTDQNGEYFVYECRGSNGWDYGLYGHGLIVTHVDKSSRKVTVYNGSTKITDQTAADLWDHWEWYNAINENGSHPCCYVVAAPDQDNLKFGYEYNSDYHAYYYNYDYDSKIPFPGSESVTSFTAKSWNGVDSDIRLSNISYSNNQVTLYATVPSNTLNYNVIANPGNGVYTAGSSFALELEQSDVQPVDSVEWFVDDEPVSSALTGDSVTLTAGTHVIEARLTLTSGETKILELAVQAN
jgi:M6 family metalloprotease-like protein